MNSYKAEIEKGGNLFENGRNNRKNKARDKEAFTEIVLKYKNLLYKIAVTKLENEEDRCEAIQETMISAFKTIHQLREVDKLKQWLVRIFINQCNSIYKKKKRNIVSIENIENIETEDMENSHTKIDIYTSMKMLKQEERDVLILYYYAGYTMKEIAYTLKRKENTVKTILRRSLMKLKKIMKGEEKHGERYY